MPKKPEEFDEIDLIAEKMYDFACIKRSDNIDKKTGLPTNNPRLVGCEYKDLWEPAMRWYRSLAEWHLNHIYSSPLPAEISISPDLGTKRDFPQVM